MSTAPARGHGKIASVITALYARIGRKNEEIARLRAAIEKHRQLVSNNCHLGADPNEELWSALEPKP